MWPRRILSTVAICCLATLAACSGDSKSVLQPSPLSPADFTSMTDALAAIIGQSANGSVPTGSRSSATASDVDFTVSAQCPVGGTIQFVGVVSASSTSSHYAVTAELRDCAARGGNDELWTFGTSPNINFTLDVRRGSESTLVLGAERGTLTWTNGSHSGSCALDVTSNTLYTTANRSYDILVNGTICGVPIDKHRVIQTG